MKIPPVDYACPASLAEAVALLAARGHDAKIIAGGQSLMPMLAFRLAAPDLLVDVRKLGLDKIAVGPGGTTLGARVRWRDIEDSKALREGQPLLCAAIDHVAHYQIRNRGTVGGSLAHADPAAEMPGLAVTLEAEISVIGSAGVRVIAAKDFFLGPLTTALKADEIITEVKLPFWPKTRRWGFCEFARRRGDFALSAVAAFYDVDAQGRATNAHIGAIGAANKPMRCAKAEAVLNGQKMDDAAIARAAEAISAEVEPPSDIHADAEYRRALTGVMCERALKQAVAQ